MTNSNIYNSIFSNISQKGGSGKVSDFMTLLNKKKGFLVLVFSNLIVQLGITYFVMTKYGSNSNSNSNSNKSSKKTNANSNMNPSVPAGLFMIQIMIVLILAFIPMPSWLKFLLFSLFSAIWGITLSNLSVDTNLIHMAIFGTMSIFGTMMILGSLLLSIGIKLSSKFALFLFLALLALIIIQIVVMFTNTYSMYVKTISIISLILFSLYIIYDTNNILQREYSGDFITASLDYYLDILNIFIDLINLNR